MGLVQWLALVVALQRVAELAYGRRNERRLLAAGGVEHGAGHYPLIVLAHAGWLAALFLLVPVDAPASVPLLALYTLLQVARYWVMASLGRYWTTRIITVPAVALVRRGPYRFLRHPNYCVVFAEIAVLPLAFSAWRIAAVFSAVNLALLWWRIRVEDAALADRRVPLGV